MLKTNNIRNLILFFLLFNCCTVYNSFAHEGHDHSHGTTPVTIERSTYTHLKSILSIYHEVYDNLIKRQLDSIPVLAQIISDTAGKGVQTELSESGRHMMEHIQEGAEGLKQAEGFQEAQDAFATISEAVFPFFKSWPKQLRDNRMKLYQCREHNRCWLQPQSLSPVCPYTINKFSGCSDISEVVSE